MYIIQSESSEKRTGDSQLFSTENKKLKNQGKRYMGLQNSRGKTYGTNNKYIWLRCPPDFFL